MKHLDRRRSVFAQVRHGVVGIGFITEDQPKEGDVERQLRPDQLTIVGTGFLIDARGYGVTAAHVLADFATAYEGFKKGEGPKPQPPYAVLQIPTEADLPADAPDQRRYHYGVQPIMIAELRKHPTFDLVAFRLGKHAARSHFRPMEFADELCREGDEIAACGYPYGRALHSDLYEGTAITMSFSHGIVSAEFPSANVPPPLATVFQIDALIAPGFSGGPVFDPLTGKVVGVVLSTHQRTYPSDESGVRDPILVPIGLSRAAHAHWASELASDLIDQVEKRKKGDK